MCFKIVLKIHGLYNAISNFCLSKIIVGFCGYYRKYSIT